MNIDKVKARFLNFSFQRENSPSVKVINKSKKVDKSQHIHQHGLTVKDAKEVVEMILDKRMMEFQIDAKNIVEERISQFKTTLFVEMNKLSEPELNRLKEPDAQFALKQAAFISSKKTNKELIDTLGKLVIGRIKNHQVDTEDLKNIVFNEAITTIDKLTPNQLKIITLCYLLSQTYKQGIKSINQFNEYFNKSIKPFLNFKNTNAEFQHIEYSGCGSLSIGSWDPMRVFRESYCLIFQKPFTADEVSKIVLEESLKTKIFMKDLESDNYTIPVTDKKILEEYLKKQNFEEQKVTEIMNEYDKHLMQTSEVEEKIKDETDIGKELLERLNSTPIKNLSLTSVGIVIAATYYENIVGEKLNIDLWIN